MSSLNRSFPTGHVRTTRLALQSCGRSSLELVLTRHCQGDWGDPGEALVSANENGIAKMGQLCSRYHLGGGDVWIITNPDRAHTTILLDGEQGQPEDYADTTLRV